MSIFCIPGINYLPVKSVEKHRHVERGSKPAYQPHALHALLLSRFLGANVLGTSRTWIWRDARNYRGLQMVEHCSVLSDRPIITRALKPALPNKIIVMRGEVLSVALTCDQHS